MYIMSVLYKIFRACQELYSLSIVFLGTGLTICSYQISAETGFKLKVMNDGASGSCWGTLVACGQQIIRHIADACSSPFPLQCGILHCFIGFRFILFEY